MNTPRNNPLLDDVVMTDYLTEVVDQAREMANANGERFNIFSILRMGRDEAATHSRFLAELLNPKGRHGEHDTFLCLFLSDLLGIQDCSGKSYRVSRESATEEKRRVDIVVESFTDVVGIELKIDATDQRSQLHDYYHELHRRSGGRKSVTLVYLTLNGREPSRHSLVDLTGDDVICLSFEDDISRWLQRCIEETQDKAVLSAAIQQYQQLIHELTGKGGSVTQLIADNLKGDIKRFKDALEVEKALPNVKWSIQELFWNDLSKAIENKFGNMPTAYRGDRVSTIPEIAKRYYKNSSKHIGINIRVCPIGDWNICLHSHLHTWFHYGLRVQDNDGNLVSARELRALYREMFGTGNAIADGDSDWLVCYYFNPEVVGDENVIDFGAFNDTAVSLLDRDSRHSLISEIVTHQAELASNALELAKRQR